MTEPDAPVIGVVMGSSSDWPTMSKAAEVLDRFGIAYEAKVVSAHRMPDEMFAYAQAAQGRGLRAVIAGAGGAAHLPGMIAAKTIVPVLGVPVSSRHLAGQDSLLSIVQMPAGVPTATFAIGEAGATNAGLFAVAMLAANDGSLADALATYRAERRDAAAASVLPTSPVPDTPISDSPVSDSSVSDVSVSDSSVSVSDSSVSVSDSPAPDSSAS